MAICPAENILPKETEKLSEKDQYNEMLMIGLRTIWGVDLEKLHEKFSGEILEIFKNSIQSKLEEGILVVEEKRQILEYLRCHQIQLPFTDGLDLAADTQIQTMLL